MVREGEKRARARARKLTRVGEVRPMSLNSVRDIFLAASEVLHVLTDDGLGSLGGECVLLGIVHSDCL